MEMTGSSLLLSDDPSRGDITLCYACHGVGQLGSNSDVQSAFEGSSVHTMTPGTAPYGPSPLYCSTCHDPHGTDRTVGNSPYPRLLRSFEASTTPVFSGEAYCATCHTTASIAQEKEHWSGLAVYAKTAHFSAMAMPTSGTQIRCSRCHAPHGSSVAPLLVSSIVPTSVVDTFTVTADDRTFCAACHPTSVGSWEGTATYDLSSHAISSVTTTISARWVPAGKRKVGECQVCHAPMGRDDGTGNPVPKLLDAAGRKLCDACHAAGGVASTDTSSQARPINGTQTLVALYDSTMYGSRGMLYGGRAAVGTLAGPRTVNLPAGSGSAAAGDIDGDGVPELVVASATDPEVSICQRDPLSGIVTTLTVAVPSGLSTRFVAVADVLDPLTYAAVPEIVLGDSNGDVSILEFDGTSLLLVDGPRDVPGASITGLTTGNVTGTALAEVVATFDNGTLLVIGDDGAHGVDTVSTNIGGSPVAPAVGDLWAATAANDIAVCDDVAATDNVRLFGVDAGVISQLGAPYTVTPTYGKARAAVAAELLTSIGPASKPELAIAFSDATTGNSSIVVVPQSTTVSGLDTAAAVSIAPGTATVTRSLIAGDVDGDGAVDLIAGNGGRPSYDATTRAPSVQIWRANAGSTDFVATPEEHFAGGTEMGASVPALVLADLGPIFPSRHPMDAGTGSHNSTETISAVRHVTCSDCHNSHEAVAAVTAAPAIQGLLKGAWGVSVSYSGGVPTFGATARATKSYQVCFRCHGQSGVAAQFDPANASMHAVVQDAATSTVPAETFVNASGWTAASVLYCTDCHGDDGAAPSQVKDLHESASAPLLRSPYLGATPNNADALCYTCHKFGAYADGSDATAAAASYFVTSTLTNLHPLHVNTLANGGQGVSCAACHVSHGSVTNPALLRDDIGFVAGGLPHSGSCTNTCHPAAPTSTRTWPGP